MYQHDAKSEFVTFVTDEGKIRKISESVLLEWSGTAWIVIDVNPEFDRPLTEREEVA